MNLAVAAWAFFRLARWLCYLVFFAFSIYFLWNRAPHLNSFGHLLPYAEMLWFGLGNGAMFAGFLELMMRERAGLARPNALQLWPGYASS